VRGFLRKLEEQQHFCIQPPHAVRGLFQNSTKTPAIKNAHNQIPHKKGLELFLLSTRQNKVLAISGCPRI